MRKLFVDTGHSAKYTGASGFRDEVAWVRSIAEELYQLLDGTYWDIIKVPDSYSGEDIGTTLVKRIEWINTKGSESDFLISIHANSANSNTARGVDVCYYTGSKVSEVEALKLAKSYSLATGIPLFNDGVSGDQGLRFGKSGLGIIRRTKPFALIIECGFVTNELDMSIDPRSAAHGIADYLNSLNDKVTNTVDTEMLAALKSLNSRGVIKDITTPSRNITLGEIALIIQRNNNLPR